MYNLTPSQYLIPPLFFSGVALSLVTSAERFNPGARRVPVKLFLDSSFYVGEIWRDKSVSVLGRYWK